MTSLNIDESPRFRQIVKLKASSIIHAIYGIAGYQVYSILIIKVM